MFLDDGGISKAIYPDGTSETRQAPTVRGDLTYSKKGVVHIEEWLTDGIRAVVVELLSDKPASAANAPGLPASFPREGATLKRENDRVAMWEYQWQPGRQVPLHAQTRDVVIVPLESGHIRLTPKSGVPRVVALTFGDGVFVARGDAFSEEASAGSPKAIVIELK